MIDPIESFRSALVRKGYSQAEMARMKGYTKQAFNQQLKNGYLKATDWAELMDVIGVDIVLIDRDTGKELIQEPVVKGHCPSVSCKINNVRYDTTKADAISSTFYLDGENEYTNGHAEELYLDKEGRFFLVVCQDGEKPKITLIDKSVAVAFIEKYGVLDERALPKEDND